MNRAAIERKSAEIEAQIAAISPPLEPGAEHAWISWTTDSELGEREALFRRHAEDGTEPSDAEQLRALAIAANASSRMAAASGPRVSANGPAVVRAHQG